MRAKIALCCLVLFTAFSAGCTQTPSPQQTTPPKTTPSEAAPNITTSASTVNTETAFIKAISSSGTWIIVTTKDLSINQNLSVDGEFKNGKKDAQGQDIIQRKIALYAQDENRKVTARYTLTVPKLTFNSPNGSIEHGTFKGDLYIAGKNFKLIDQTIEGNVYFASSDVKATFTMDATSKITGKQELKTP